jgi:hypothetical protein
MKRSVLRVFLCRAAGHIDSVVLPVKSGAIGETLISDLLREQANESQRAHMHGSVSLL